MAGRWVTFDCYATLVDWWTGMGSAAEAVAGERGAEVLEAYHRHELQLESKRPIRPYREILREGLRRAAADTGVELAGAGDQAFVRAWTGMPVFDRPAGLDRPRPLRPSRRDRDGGAAGHGGRTGRRRARRRDLARRRFVGPRPKNPSQWLIGAGAGAGG